MANSPSSRSMGTVAMRWHGDRLELLDQRLLPGEEHWITSEGASGVPQCIADMAVRGAPAIGISAAYAVALAARHAGTDDWPGDVERACDEGVHSRPTAVNRSWARSRRGQVSGAC